MNKPAHPELRPKLLDFCIGLVEDLYGRPDTYEELHQLLEREFPQMDFTLDEVINLYSLVREEEDLERQMSQAMLYDKESDDMLREYLNTGENGDPEPQQPGML